MKITLHDPPEGFEAEAELRLPKFEESYISVHSGLVTKAGFDFEQDSQIVLTPKKSKYWRLDQVATFEEATPSNTHRTIRTCLDSHGDVYLQGSSSEVKAWLKLTECEE